MMELKVLMFLVTGLLFSRLTHEITTPEDRCMISESGLVCMDCFSRGTCFLNEEDETYSVIFESKCPSTPMQFYCDDTISDPQDFGSCSSLPTAVTNCSCSSSTRCIEDVNNPAVILHCEDSTPVTDPPCLFSSLDLEACSCASLVESCPFVDDPNDNCSSYFVSIGDNLIPVSCDGALCFDQESCGCVISEKALIETSKAIPEDDNCYFIDDPTGDCGSYFIKSNLMKAHCVDDLCYNQEICNCEVPASKCSDECHFIDDPNDNCQNYFICAGDTLPLAQCAENLCFDQDLCNCVVREETSTEQSTTIFDCPYIADVNGGDDCASYYIYDGTKLIPASCDGNSCFDEEACDCLEPLPTCSSTTTTCLFLDDPNDNCASYYVCNGNNLISISCAAGLCFDQESCACVQTTKPSSTISPTSCSEDCPFLDNPDGNCQSYFVCNGNELIPASCSSNTCFDQESCSCLVKTTTKISTTTVTSTRGISTTPVTPTCPSGCPFVDDPNDDTCHKFFVCQGTELISHDCPGVLCFVQETCQCQ